MLAGVGDGSKGDPQVDPPPSLPTHTYTNTHKHPQLQGFAINTNAGEGNGEGGGQGVQWWGGKGRRQCCRNAEIRDRIQKKNLI